MNRHFRSGSRTNRDRRDQAYARSVIAEATRRHNAADLARRMDEMLAATEGGGEIEVCPDCFGSGKIVRHVTDNIMTEAICLECSGRGWIN